MKPLEAIEQPNPMLAVTAVNGTELVEDDMLLGTRCVTVAAMDRLEVFSF
jgi:hypothetical protein